jgi:hypothetical protein
VEGAWAEPRAVGYSIHSSRETSKQRLPIAARQPYAVSPAFMRRVDAESASIPIATKIGAFPAADEVASLAFSSHNKYLAAPIPSTEGWTIL